MSSAKHFLVPSAVGLVLLAACAPKRAPAPAPPPAPLLPVITFTVQAGAFAEAGNAMRLARSLDSAGVEAFHFVGPDGLNRVRFGSFASREAAASRAEALKAASVIAEYAVVPAAAPGAARTGLRGEIARAALSFLGIGLRPPVVSWGVLLIEVQNLNAVALYPWLLVTMVPVIVTVLAFNFLGDGLRDAADPYK